MIDYGRFRSSLQLLQEQHDNLRRSDVSHPELIREAIAESVTRRFNTCYDCLWKC